ncbi:MAG: hypothetical protein M1815_005245 [Lichina confinis]|nr:MAG: hypothetical protein M1815_005245 [Lichina confinis]
MERAEKPTNILSVETHDRQPLFAPLAPDIQEAREMRHGRSTASTWKDAFSSSPRHSGRQLGHAGMKIDPYRSSIDL